MCLHDSRLVFALIWPNEAINTILLPGVCEFRSGESSTSFPYSSHPRTCHAAWWDISGPRTCFEAIQKSNRTEVSLVMRALDVRFLKFLSSRSYSQPVFAIGRVLYSLPLAGKPEEYRTYITSVSPRNPQHPVTPPLFISLTSPLATIVIRNGTGRVQSVQEPYESTPGPPRYQVPSPHYRKGKRREDDHPAASV
jgi:hypothetical protein